jgi:hypothetical protein
MPHTQTTEVGRIVAVVANPEVISHDGLHSGHFQPMLIMLAEVDYKVQKGVFIEGWLLVFDRRVG